MQTLESKVRIVPVGIRAMEAVLQEGVARRKGIFRDKVKRDPTELSLKDRFDVEENEQADK